MSRSNAALLGKGGVINLLATGSPRIERTLRSLLYDGGADRLTDVDADADADVDAGPGMEGLQRKTEGSVGETRDRGDLSELSVLVCCWKAPGGFEWLVEGRADAYMEAVQVLVLSPPPTSLS